MAVEPLWRWLREDVTYHHCHATAEDLIRRVAAFEVDVNADPCVVADRLWVKDHLDPEEEKLRLDGTAVAEWAASPRGVLKFRPHSVGIAIDLVCTCQGRSDIAVYRSS